MFKVTDSRDFQTLNAGTCQLACKDMSVPCWGASRVGMITAGWPLRGDIKNTKIPKKFKKKEKKEFKSKIKRV